MAQAILLKDVENVGERGDVIDVSSGYLRNYLLPRKLAQSATPGAIQEAKRRMDAAEKAAKDMADRAQENAALLSRTVLTIPQAAGDDGRLFGSVTAQDIADAIKQARGLKVDKRRVHLDEPIKTAGTHMVTVEVHDGVTADVKTIVTPEA
jgi:large subunit ribosomal protein L9